jgi:choline dehydrogenase-like flavoprotein
MRGHAPEGPYDPEHDWNLNMNVSNDGSSMQVPQGKIMGGGSAINGSIFLRGSTVDYDKDWAGLGNPSWKWRDVLPLSKPSRTIPLLTLRSMAVIGRRRCRERIQKNSASLHVLSLIPQWRWGIITHTT